MSDVSRASDVIQRTRELFSGRVERTPVDVNALISETLALTRARIDINQVSLEVELGSKLDFVVVDRIQLEQVLLNLVGNALDADEGAPDRPRALSIQWWRTAEDVRTPSATRGPGYPVDWRIASSARSTRPNPMGLGWGSLSAAPSSRRTGGNCWPSLERMEARHSRSCCRSSPERRLKMLPWRCRREAEELVSLVSRNVVDITIERWSTPEESMANKAGGLASTASASSKLALKPEMASKAVPVLTNYVTRAAARMLESCSRER